MSTATDTHTYRSKEAAEAIGCTYRQLDYWDRTKVIVPSISRANGGGSRRLYSEQDIQVGRAVAALSTSVCSSKNGHFALDQARRIVPILRGFLAGGSLPDGIYVTGDGRLSLTPVTGTYIALADLESASIPGDVPDVPPTPGDVTGTPSHRGYCVVCGDPSPWPICSKACAQGEPR